MARLGARDRQRVGEVAASIRSLRERSPRALPELLPVLREVLGAERSGAYGVRRGVEGFALEFAQFPDFEEPGEQVAGDMARHLRTRKRVGFYDPACPPPRQRDRGVAIPWRRWAEGDEQQRIQRLYEDLPRLGASPERLGEVARSVLDFQEDVTFGTSVECCNQLRALICEGSSVLAWVGVFQHDDFTERQRLMLQSLVPPLKERLLLERRLDEAMLNHAGLHAALELLAVPAFLVDGTGRPQHANALGRELLGSERGDTTEVLRSAVKDPCNPAYAATPLRAPGLGNYYLLTGRRPARDPTPMAAEAGTKWELTRRETAVLDRAARGESNKAIAARLGCADRTVELHVSSILRKAGFESRSQLIAELWRRFG